VAHDIAGHPRAVDRHIVGDVRRGGQEPLHGRVELGEQVDAHGQLRAIRDLRAGADLVCHGQDLRSFCRDRIAPPAGMV